MKARQKTMRAAAMQFQRTGLLRRVYEKRLLIMNAIETHMLGWYGRTFRRNDNNNGNSSSSNDSSSSSRQRLGRVDVAQSVESPTVKRLRIGEQLESVDVHSRSAKPVRAVQLDDRDTLRSKFLQILERQRALRAAAEATLSGDQTLGDLMFDSVKQQFQGWTTHDLTVLLSLLSDLFRQLTPIFATKLSARPRKDVLMLTMIARGGDADDLQSGDFGLLSEAYSTVLRLMSR